jgi:hypothetical protein
MICNKCKKSFMDNKKSDYNKELAVIFDTDHSEYCDKCLDFAYHAAAVAYWKELGELND